MTYQSHLVTFKEQRAFECAKALQEGFETESRQAFCSTFFRKLWWAIKERFSRLRKEDNHWGFRIGRSTQI